MTRRLRILGPVALFSLAGCSDGPSGAMIYGHATMRGLTDHSGITITLSHGSAEVTTDAYGYFAIPDVPRGEYYVTANNESTFERKVSVFVDHDGSLASSASLTLSPYGRLTGTVTDPDGGPIQFATVRVLGTDVSTTSIEGGAFTIDQAPAGQVVVWASYGDFKPGQSEVSIPVGEAAAVSVALGEDEGPGPYSQNRPPGVSEITLTSLPAVDYPQVIPLVDTTGNVVRRGGRYLLSVTPSDPDGDAITTYFSTDRGTLESATGEPQTGDSVGVVWRAAGGISTLSCTVLDPYGATATARLVVEATGDNQRSGGRHGNTVYYSERRTDTFDLFRYSFVAGTESLTAGGSMQQHAATVIGDWLVYGDMEFVFIGSLIYRITATNLVSGASYQFGQAFGHDDYFVMRLDLYTPLHSPFIPYYCSGTDSDGDGFGDKCNAYDNTPLGYGYFNLSTGQPTPTPPFSTAPFGPANLRSFARHQDRDVWVSTNGQLWRQQGTADPVAVAAIPGNPVYPSDLQLYGDIAAVLPRSGHPLYWVDVTVGAPAHEVGYQVTSFALHGRRLAYVEQGPTSATVELLDLDSGQQRTLTTAPHFARRIWFMDDDYIIWGDQGTEGQAFVALSTELLWLDKL